MSAEGNHKKQFDAEDIRRYYAGEMNSSEMHAMEKAALEDPFLADAMDGYQAMPEANIKSDMSELAARLNEKTSGKVIPVVSGRRNWYRYAAAAVLIVFAAGGGWILLNQQRVSPAVVVQQKAVQAPKAATPDTSNNKISSQVAPPATEKDSQRASLVRPSQHEKVSNRNEEGSKTLSAAPAGEQEVAQSAKAEPDVTPDKASAAEKDDNKKKESDAVASRKAPQSAPEANAARAGTQAYMNTHLIKGRVISKNGRALPFVNMQVNNDRDLLYTNAAGEFKIVTGDTSLDVQVKSVGYVDKNARISANVMANTIVLDTALFDKTAKYKNAIKNSINTDSLLRVESEAEPIDGWVNYEIYVDNNIRVPNANQPGARSGMVELSFLVNKNGTLSGFRIERGLDAASDREAIRVVKEGPKWQITSGEEPVRVSLMILF